MPNSSFFLMKKALSWPDSGWLAWAGEIWMDPGMLVRKSMVLNCPPFGAYSILTALVPCMLPKILTQSSPSKC